MDMVVVMLALFTGLAVAVPAQLFVHVFNIKNDTPYVLGAFSVAMLMSAPFFAKLLGV